MTSTEPDSDTTRPHSNVCYASDVVYTPPPNNCYGIKGNPVFPLARPSSVPVKPLFVVVITNGFP